MNDELNDNLLDESIQLIEAQRAEINQLLERIHTLEGMVREYHAHLAEYHALYSSARAWNWVEQTMALQRRAERLLADAGNVKMEGRQS